MRREIGRWRVLINVGFASAVLGLGSAGLYQVALRHWKVQPTFHVRARFETIGGVEVGHRVRFQGIDAGVVERIVPPNQPGEPVELVLRIDERLRALVRTDSVARIISEGLIGAKIVEIAPGRPDAAPAAEMTRIASERPIELSDFLKRATTSLARLDAVAGSAEKGLAEITTLAASIRRGEGSLGKLVQDDGLYQHLTDLSRRGERTLTSLEENLDALKQTWPLSRYFDSRAYLDRERVLFQPGADRRSRTLHSDDLFEPGRSVLTNLGRIRLDEIGRWCNQSSQPTSEVVIAAFTDSVENQNLADILTQEQAETVRKYLVEKHSIQSAGWFHARKVAAVGFGNHAPPAITTAAIEGPSRRIEVIVFTPRTS
jgi:phospholipid/cholesterol/gamma-HCH transport system substrate-binding protein